LRDAIGIGGAVRGSDAVGSDNVWRDQRPAGCGEACDEKKKDEECPEAFYEVLLHVQYAH
jgi:hypothetical protein